MSDADMLSEKETKRRAEAALKKISHPPKQYGPKGKASRAESHKANKVQPAHQRNRRQKGR